MSRNVIRGIIFALAFGYFAGSAHAQTYQQYVQIWNTTWATYLAEEAIPLPQRGVVV